MSNACGSWHRSSVRRGSDSSSWIRSGTRRSDPPVPREVAPGLPIFRDEGGTLARRLGASYATESYIVDATGHVRYRGGIDSDRKYLRPDTQPYLRQALLKLLAGQGPAFATTKALGCALRLL